MRIDPGQTTIIGNWIQRDGKIVEDAVCQRIRDLVNSHLTLLGRSEDGWNKLYLDDADLRFWELTLPWGEMHGGGPPKLEVVDLDSVIKRYGADVVAIAGATRRKGR